MRILNVPFLLALLTQVHGISDKFNGEYSTLPPLREQAALKDAWTKSRIDSIPALLSKHGVDAWLVLILHYPLLAGNLRFEGTDNTMNIR